MIDRELQAVWNVLQTEAEITGVGIKARPVGVKIADRDVMLGTDHFGHRHVLIPLSDGEAFAEDRSGRSVHLIRVQHRGYGYLSAVCLASDLEGVFSQFVADLLRDLADSTTPAQDTIFALARWRALLADAVRGTALSDRQVIGLLAELLVLEQLMQLDDERRVAVWTGPDELQHDFRCGRDALEVKATLTREGLFVPISSVHQLEAPQGGSLHLVHHRFEEDTSGESLGSVTARIGALAIQQARFGALLAAVIGSPERVDDYADRTFRLTERRVYDVAADGFPKVVLGSFVGGVVPPGVLRLTYQIDLTNEPPTPINPAETDALFEQLARWS